MSVLAGLLMAGGVAIILTAPDLSGFSALGAAVFLLGLWVAQASESDRG